MTQVVLAGRTIPPETSYSVEARIYISEELLFDLFGDFFVWWYVVALQGRQQLGLDVQDLYDWLKGRAEVEPDRTARWDEWHRAAQRDRMSGPRQQRKSAQN